MLAGLAVPRSVSVEERERVSVSSCVVVFGDAEVPRESGKKLKLRPPAASPEDGGDDLADLTELVLLEQEANLQRFDERDSIRMRSRAALFR